MDKAQLRAQLRCARLALGAKERSRAQHRVVVWLKRFMRRGHKVAVYWPMGSELDVSAWVKMAQRCGMQVYLPHIVPNCRRLWFTPHPVVAQPRLRQRWRIPQFHGQYVRARQLHMVIVPLIGVDDKGVRLGQGGGYYDATLQRRAQYTRPRKVGVGFACQKVDHLPVQSHDVCLDYFVSEQGIMCFK